MNNEWLFLAPRSNEQSRENFLATLDSGYPIEEIGDFLTSEEKEYLGSRKKLYIWGNQEAKKDSWSKMKIGDYVAFYAKGELVYIGNCILKKQSAEIARKLWGNVSGKDVTWEYVFFLDKIRPISIPINIIRELAGYKEKMIVQGFMPLNEQGMENILSTYGSLESFFDSYSLGVEPKTYDFLSRISEKDQLSAEELEGLDRIMIEKDPDVVLKDLEQRMSVRTPELVESKIVKLRRNQTLVREMKRKYGNKCQVCGFTFKKRNGDFYSEVAHIRALSSKEQGVDSPSNLVVLCPNHHKMMDLGMLEIISNTHYKLDNEVFTLDQGLFTSVAS